jgi:dimethylglycine dehydrogenase
VPVELVGPERLAELHPLIDTRGLRAAAYLPSDGHVDPSGLTNAFVRGAPAIRIRRRTPVLGIRRERGGWTLETPAGAVRAEIVVNAAGQWARQVGRLAGVDLPLVPLQHQYVVTAPLPEVAALERELPVLRDADASYYVRQEGEALLLGPFERVEASALRILAAVGGRPGHVFNLGHGVLPDTDPADLRRLTELVHEHTSVEVAA